MTAMMIVYQEGTSSSLVHDDDDESEKIKSKNQ
jgi:hypothetical protein